MTSTEIAAPATTSRVDRHGETITEWIVPADDWATVDMHAYSCTCGRGNTGLHRNSHHSHIPKKYRHR